MQSFRAMTVLCVCSIGGVADAGLVAAWNFNDDVKYGAGTSFSADAGDSGATLNLDAGWGADSNFDGTGTTVNQNGTDIAGDALQFARPNSHQSQGLEMQFSMSNLHDAVLTFAGQRTNNGFTTVSLQYSTDGNTFVEIGTRTLTEAYQAYSIDFSSAPINGLATAFIRAEFTGGSSNGLSQFANIDNVQILAAPEPTSLALMGLGLSSLGLVRIKRRRQRVTPPCMKQMTLPMMSER